MRSSAELGRRTQDSANADYPEAWCRVDGTNARIARTQILPRGGGALGWHERKDSTNADYPEKGGRYLTCQVPALKYDSGRYLTCQVRDLKLHASGRYLM